MPQQYHPYVTLIKNKLTSNTRINAHLTILTFFNSANKDAYTVIETALNDNEKIKELLERLDVILENDYTSNRVLYVTGEIYNQIMEVVRHQKVKNELAQYRSSTPPTTNRDSAPKIAGLR